MSDYVDPSGAAETVLDPARIKAKLERLTLREVARQRKADPALTLTAARELAERVIAERHKADVLILRAWEYGTSPAAKRKRWAKGKAK